MAASRFQEPVLCQAMGMLGGGGLWQGWRGSCGRQGLVTDSHVFASASSTSSSHRFIRLPTSTLLISLARYQNFKGPSAQSLGRPGSSQIELFNRLDGNSAVDPPRQKINTHGCRPRRLLWLGLGLPLSAPLSWRGQQGRLSWAGDCRVCGRRGESLRNLQIISWVLSSF